MNVRCDSRPWSFSRGSVGSSLWNQTSTAVISFHSIRVPPIGAFTVMPVVLTSTLPNAGSSRNSATPSATTSSPPITAAASTSTPANARWTTAVTTNPIPTNARAAMILKMSLPGKLRPTCSPPCSVFMGENAILRTKPLTRQHPSPYAAALMVPALVRLAVACNRFWPVVIPAAALATAASVWVAVARLDLVSDRNDLVNEEADFNRRYENYIDDFGDQEYVIVVIEGRDRDAMKSLARRVSDRVRASDLFEYVIERVDPAGFGDAGLLYLPEGDLEKIVEQIDFAVRGAARYEHLGPEGIARAATERIRRADPLTEDDVNEGLLAAGLLAEYYFALSGRTSDRGVTTMPISDDPSLDPDGYLFSPDGSMLYLQIMPLKSMGTLDQIEKPIQETREILATELGDFPQLRAGITGLPAIYSDEMATTSRDMTRASILAMALIGVLFAVMLRSIVRPLLAVVTLGAAIAWTFGVTALILGRLNLFAMVFTIVLVALGIDFGVHILTQYLHHFLLNTRQAVRDTFAHAGRGLIVGGLTTAAAFLSTMLTGFRGLTELGLISGVGLVICLLAMCTLFPALLGMIDGFRRGRIVDDGSEPPDAAPGRPSWIAVSAMAAAGVVLIPGVEFDYNLLALQSPALDSVVWEYRMLKGDPRALFNVSMCDTRDELERKREAFERLSAVGRVESLYPDDEPAKRGRLARAERALRGVELPPFVAVDVDRARDALESLIRAAGDDRLRNLRLVAHAVRMQLGAARDDPPRRRLVDDVQMRLRQDLSRGVSEIRRAAAAPAITTENAHPELVRMFVGRRSGRPAIKVFPKENLWEWEPLKAYVAATRDADPDIVGVPIQTFESSRMLLRAFLMAAWLSLCAVVLLIGLSFWSVRDTVIAVSPLLLGVAILLGVMRLAGISFNFANFFAVPILIGTGVDNGVHLVNTARAGIPLAGTRRAVTLCSLTTIIGFGMLVFSAHKGISSLGMVLAIGSAASLLVSHTVTTALIRAWRPTAATSS